MEMKIVIQIPESVEALLKTMLKGCPASVQIEGVDSPEIVAAPNVETTKRRGRPKKEKSESAQSPTETVSAPSPTETQNATTTAESAETPTATTGTSVPSSGQAQGWSLDSIRDLVLKTKNGIELSKSILAEMGVQKIGELSPEQRVDFVAKLGML